MGQQRIVVGGEQADERLGHDPSSDRPEGHRAALRAGRPSAGLDRECVSGRFGEE